MKIHQTPKGFIGPTFKVRTYTSKLAAAKHLNKIHLAVFAFIFAGLGSYIIFHSFAATTCDINVNAASNANLNSAINTAAPGQTVCLASGDYGTFGGVSKSSPGVTIAAQAGAKPEMAVHFGNQNNAAWLTFDGVKLHSSLLCGPAHDIKFQNLEMAGQLLVFTGAANNACSDAQAMNNNNIVFDNVNFSLSDDPDGHNIIEHSYEGRVQFLDQSANTAPAGFTIKNSMFNEGPGNGRCGDLMQFAGGGNGVTIGPGNTFENNGQDACDAFWPQSYCQSINAPYPCAPHSDSIQGSSLNRVIITGNYFHDLSTGVVNYDGGATNVTVSNNVFQNIEGDNVCVGGSTGLVVEHNTDVTGSFTNCTAHDVPGSTGSIFRNNIVHDDIDNAGTGTFAVKDYNFCITGTCAGTHSISSKTPVFSGGTSPNAYSGFALAAGSPGKGAASDGTDMGVSAVSAPTPTNCAGLVGSGVISYSSLDACGYPSPNTTGVPAGTTLTSKASVNCTNTTVNAISTSDITIGSNCTLTNSRITGEVMINGATNVRISHTEISGAYTGTPANPACSYSGTGGTTGQDYALVNFSDATDLIADHLYLHCAAEAFNGVGQISDSYIISDECYGPCDSGNTTHNEAAYVPGGGSTANATTVFDHNTLLSPWDQTAALFGDDHAFGPIHNLTINNNLLATAGTNGPIAVGGAGDGNTGINITNNRLSYVYDVDMPVFGSGSARPEQDGSWCGNYRDDSPTTYLGPEDNAGVACSDSGGTSSDTSPPTVSITAPAANATLSGSSVALSANAADDTGIIGVQFKVDGAAVEAEDTSSPYSTIWDSKTATNGTHTITATARDAAGNSTASSPITVTVNNPITPGDFNVGETTVLSTDDSGNGNLLVAQAATLTQAATLKSLSFYVTTAAGKLRLGLYDATGPSGGPGHKLAETTEIIPVTGWNTANVLNQISLSAGGYWLAYLPSSSSLAFKKTDTSAVQSQYYSYTYGTLPAVFATTTSTTPSHWSLYATFNTTTTPDTTAPTVSLTTPAAGATVSGSSVAVAASAADTGGSGLAGVQFYLDYAGDPASNKLGSEDISPPFSTTLNTTTLGNGSHTLTAIARDNAGNTKQATPITITVNNVSPPTPDTTPPSVPAGLADSSKTTTSITLSWNQSTDSGTNASGVGGYRLYNANTNALLKDTTSRTCTVANLSPNTAYSFKVSAYDKAGNESSRSSSVTVSTNAQSSGGTTQTFKNGDVNHDNSVNLVDLSMLLARYNSRDTSADFNHDGTVGLVDLSLLLGNYGG